MTASDAFTTLFLFSALRFPINYAGKLMGKIAQGVQACQRISKFLEPEIHPSENNQLTGFDHRHEIRDNEKNSVFLSIINGNFTVRGGGLK